MKKVLTFVCALIMCLSSGLLFASCKKSNNLANGVIRLNEVTHSVFYAPLYVAINLGYMKEEGITIELVNGGGSDASMAALLSNSADIALMGPETVVYVENSGSTNHPIVFGQLTKKDGCFLMSKSTTQTTETDISKILTDSYVIAGRQGGMPAMTFEWLCKNYGLFHGTNITLDTDTAFTLMVSVFEASNEADYCTMFEPTASEWVASGKGSYVLSVGELSGEIPYTCFISYPSFLTKHQELATGFLSAIKKAYIYINSHTSAEVAAALAPSFDGTSEASLAAAIEKYLEIDVWAATPAMSKDSYSRLLAVLKNAGEIDNDVEFSAVVNNSIANTI